MKKIFLFIAVTILIGLNCSRKEDLTPIVLNLDDVKQQSDFKNYLEKTLNLLTDKSNISFFQGYDLSNLSNNDKTNIADNMLKDHNFMSKLMDYQKIVKYIEKKYRASSFTKEQWNEIAKFGMNQGIYFLPGLKEKVKNMEEKSFAMMQINNGNRGTFMAPSCADQVDAANAELASSVASMSGFCLLLSEFPPAAAICWAGVTAYFLSENARINSIEYWCDCMIANYGYCAY